MASATCIKVLLYACMHSLLKSICQGWLLYIIQPAGEAMQQNCLFCYSLRFASLNIRLVTTCLCTNCWFCSQLHMLCFINDCLTQLQQIPKPQFCISEIFLGWVSVVHIFQRQPRHFQKIIIPHFHLLLAKSTDLKAWIECGISSVPSSCRWNWICHTSNARIAENLPPV